MITVDKARRIVNGLAERYYNCIEDDERPNVDASVPAIWLESLRSCSLLFVYVLMAYATRDKMLTMDEAQQILKLVNERKLEGVSHDASRKG